jgi:hypothetical protein
MGNRAVKTISILFIVSGILSWIYAMAQPVNMISVETGFIAMGIVFLIGTIFVFGGLWFNKAYAKPQVKEIQKEIRQ